MSDLTSIDLHTVLAVTLGFLVLVAIIFGAVRLYSSKTSSSSGSGGRGDRDRRRY